MNQGRQGNPRRRLLPLTTPAVPLEEWRPGIVTAIEGRVVRVTNVWTEPDGVLWASAEFPIVKQTST